ncbi:uncharacterized protein EDB91DRAFT_1326114 [Suillus paluster]|uniref:uncharacterized protein n=1 Tax=Suillus paluster TaxID=48578 RepID=UPI001B875BB8|nr:uncharacterized protein EDB91DRAFT_1326114 [Suillus paluster]KAG1755208.1 hypothetical protein EDB91DRAFT_1326114 [Suillus paluster]
MSDTDRRELVRNAVSFLSDSTTQQAPVAQRVQFLEAKGLTGPEIEEAMKQAANQTVRSQPAPQLQNYFQSPYPTYGPTPYPGYPSQQWDWRDYFITAVISGSVVYGAVSLFKKYLQPHLIPPAATAYEQDRDGLTAQFDAAEALLKEIQAETEAVKSAVYEQNERVDKVTKDVEAVVVEMREGESKTRDEMREIRDEVENIREMLPKMIEKNKESQKESLAELQQELKSLKALLLSRGSAPLTSSPSTPIPSLAGRPSIPAWQLASSASVPSAAESLPSTPDPGLRKFTLEERLRASFSVGEASNTTTPAISSRVSPAPNAVPVTQHPLSPTFIPLPASPVLPAAASPPQVSDVQPSDLPADPLPFTLAVNHLQDASEEGSHTIVSSEVPQALADIPLPLSPEEKPPIDNSDSLPVPASASTVTEEALADIPLSLNPEEKLPTDNSDSLPVPVSASTATEDALADISLPLNPEEKPATDSSDSLPVPVSTSTVTEENPQLLDHLPAVTDTVHASDVHGSESRDVDSNTDVPIQVDVSASDDDVDGDRTEQPLEDPPVVPSAKRSEADVEALQERLRLVELRFSDVSTSFKRLQAERSAVDDVIRELTPLEDTEDVTVLRDYLANMNMKTELAQDELQRLNGKLTRQEERIEELRDTHRLETRSQLDQIDKLRQQLNEAEALVSASQASASHTEEEIARQNVEIERLAVEAAKAKEVAKEEEEKRVKAISLLKTVRQKLVKAEKDRDDAVKELGESKEKERQERDKERAERARLQSEIDVINAEREKAVAGLRTQFDKEVAAVKDRSERELSAAHAQYEAEIAALKISHSTELTHKRSQIATLEASVNKLSRENRTSFEQLQIRQAELESSQHHVGTLQSQDTELQFQLREAQDHVTLLTEEISDLRGEQETRPHGQLVPQEDISQLISTMEAKYEAKLAEIKRNLILAEKERTESEADWSRKLCEKSRETDELKMILQSSAKMREEKHSTTGVLQGEIEKLTAEVQDHQRRALEFQLQVDLMKDAETSFQLRISDAKAETEGYRNQLESLKAHEAQLRGHIKTLREELRKVQNSAALLERQRNPGVGYWTSRSENSDSRASISSVSDLPSRTASPGPTSPTPSKGDEEVNLEYLRNVILQFLEHKEMRPNLVRVLSIILRFTPQETRRLIAKVQ